MFSKNQLLLTQISYFTKKASDLTDEELDSVATLFSKNYGKYSSKHPEKLKQNKQIKLSISYYKNKIVNNNYTYVALAYNNDLLVGHAFYVIDETRQGNMTWVIQLVVKKEFRKKGIAKRLLFSIWGFSNDFAWGLATTNPLTIKTLESATLRKVSLEKMKQNINYIKALSDKVNFIKREDIYIDKNNSVVNSNYFVSHDDIPDLISKYGDKWVFGDLNEGYEWLAFTFKSQELRNISKKDIDNFISYSEQRLKDAYSRMDMTNQSWTKNTKAEINYLQKFITDKSNVIIDLGCGTSRHISELYARGFYNVYGYDFSDILIEKAKELHPEIADRVFVNDCRYLKRNLKADCILCLYDVIGSFPNEKDNNKIIKNAYKLLNQGGVFILSVMNMELTTHIAKNNFDVYKNPKKLFRIKASQIMQKTGDVFNPDTYVIDKHTGLVFRKEIFKGDGFLDSEYIIRDKRYTRNEIESILKCNGFEIIESKYVSAGKFDNALENINSHAKEILIICKKR